MDGATVRERRWSLKRHARLARAGIATVAPAVMPTAVAESRPILSRLLSVPYRPDPEARAFVERAQTATLGALSVTAAALSDHESNRFFGVRMARRGLQPVWLRVRNGSAEPLRLDLLRLDPRYYTPLEAAWVNHHSVGRRLLGFGLLAWLFLPLLPLLPWKLVGARRANRRMNAFFKTEAFPAGPIPPGDERSGFVFTMLDEGTKSIDVALVGAERIHELALVLDVPGLDVEAPDAETTPLEELDETRLRAWLQGRPRATSNPRGTVEGDPLNLVVVGSAATVRACFGARWDDAESIDLATCWKTFKAFLLESGYRYSPVSPLYLDGRQQDMALQRARASINERLHLRLWRTDVSFGNAPVWIGQVSRDIGVRFTPRTWNLTTHKIDPDVDEARDYVVDDLMAARRVARLGYAGGVEAAAESTPRRNLTGDPYFTDGRRAVVVLSDQATDAAFLAWT